MADNLDELWIALEVCSEPMFELLLTASAIYFVLGAIGETLILIGLAVTTVAIAIAQSQRSKGSLARAEISLKLARS